LLFFSMAVHNKAGHSVSYSWFLVLVCGNFIRFFGLGISSS
jgi:hypothetical protein